MHIYSDGCVQILLLWMAIPQAQMLPLLFVVHFQRRHCCSSSTHLRREFNSLTKDSDKKKDPGSHESEEGILSCHQTLGTVESLGSIHRPMAYWRRSWAHALEVKRPVHFKTITALPLFCSHAYS